ncbi:MAG: Ser-tRNA(Thr) hydrolase [Gammaproteobacteria bacterium]|nr:Ser-tRNA(Thr) hydrolase [Gammaproteobacteria bacterium]
MPERLGAHYIAEDGSKKAPVMLHRAILGSMERFLGILLEEYAGRLPLWLAPVQIVVLNITDSQKEFVSNMVEMLKNSGLRVTADLRNEKIGFKIREHTLKNVPYLVIVGDKEMASNTVAVRTRSGMDLGVFAVSDFIQKVKQEIKARVVVASEVESKDPVHL